MSRIVAISLITKALVNARDFSTVRFSVKIRALTVTLANKSVKVGILHEALYRIILAKLKTYDLKNKIFYF